MNNDFYPLVSVAIITYNQREFLHDCIESVLAQTYKNLEIVVADDGSKDGTHEMLLDYQQRFPDKFVLRLSEQNKGITPNSNEAHFACAGKYIAWMGGDDLMLPEKIEKQVEYMEANPNCTICYHDLDVFDSATGDTLYRFNERHKPREGGVEACIRYGVFNGACASMVRADKAPKDGFNSRLPVASDWMYWIDSLANGGTIKFLNSTLGRYRRHSSNVTNSTSTMGVNQIDHMDTLNITLSKYPNRLNEVAYSWSSQYWSLRRKLPYFRTVFLSLRINAQPKVALALCVFALTLGLIRL